MFDNPIEAPAICGGLKVREVVHRPLRLTAGLSEGDVAKSAKNSAMAAGKQSAENSNKPSAYRPIS